MQQASTYSSDHLEAIEGWLKDGLSALRIADAFANRFRIDKSRNAIIGVIHRTPALKRLYSGRAPARPDTRREPSHNVGRRQPQPKLQRPAIVRTEPVFRAPPRPVDRNVYDAEAKRVPLAELGWRDCKFPVNDAAPGETHLFCGMPQDPGSSYCAHHMQRCCGGYSAAAAIVGAIRHAS